MTSIVLKALLKSNQPTNRENKYCQQTFGAGELSVEHIYLS